MIKSKLKVLLLSPPPDATGGIARWTRNILNYYGSIKCENESVELEFFPMGRSKFITPASSYPLRFKQGIYDYTLFFIRLVKFVRVSNPSVAHIVSSSSFGLFKDVVLQLFFKRKGVKNIIHFRFGRIPDLSFRRNWEWKVLTYVVRQSDLTLVLDRDSYNVLRGHGFSNVELLPNPLSPDTIDFINTNKREIHRIKGRVVFAGQMLPTKGVFELIQTCLQIPDIKLVMLGKLPDGMRSTLLSMAGTKGTSDWIEIKDEVSSEIVLKEMMSSHVFVLPSYTEGFPNVILEAMACGCSIISTNVGAIPEMLNVKNESYPCGICIDPKDVSSLELAVKQVLQDQNLAESMAIAAKMRVHECYEMGAIWNRLTGIWLKL